MASPRSNSRRIAVPTITEQTIPRTAPTFPSRPQAAMAPRPDPTEVERFLYTILSQVDMPKVSSPPSHSHPAPPTPYAY